MIALNWIIKKCQLFWGPSPFKKQITTSIEVYGNKTIWHASICFRRKDCITKTKTYNNHTNHVSHLRTCFSKANVSFDKHLKQLQDQGREKVRISFANVPVESIDHGAV